MVFVSHGMTEPATCVEIGKHRLVGGVLMPERP
jgi:hypothetical protein